MRARKRPGLAACERGVAAIETALTLPIFLAMLLGTIEVAMMLWTQGSLQYAVETAARCASVDPTDCGSPNAITAYALANYFGLAPPGGANPFTYSATGCGHTVTGSYTYALGIPFVAAYSVPLSATACYP
jgi:uncharacterized membrane protein